MILFNVIELDKPDEAVKLLTADLDESIRTYVSLAAKSPTDLTESVCLELGDWYYKKLPRQNKNMELTPSETQLIGAWQNVDGVVTADEICVRIEALTSQPWKISM